MGNVKLMINLMYNTNDLMLPYIVSPKWLTVTALVNFEDSVKARGEI